MQNILKSLYPCAGPGIFTSPKSRSPFSVEWYLQTKILVLGVFIATGVLMVIGLLIMSLY